MSSVPSIALFGMNAAARSLEVSARRIANPSAAAPGQDAAAPAPKLNAAAASGADLAGEAVTQMIARYDFASNAVVLRTHAQMMRSLFDTTA